MSTYILHRWRLTKHYFLTISNIFYVILSSWNQCSAAVHVSTEAILHMLIPVSHVNGTMSSTHWEEIVTSNSPPLQPGEPGKHTMIENWVGGDYFYLQTRPDYHKYMYMNHGYIIGNRGRGNSTVVSVSLCQAGGPGSCTTRSACHRKVRFYHFVIHSFPPVPTTGSK